MTDDAPIHQADFDALLELLSEQTMREVVTMFVEAAPARVALLRSGAAGGDLTQAATAAHTMRSGCGQLGARRLEQLCADSERMAKRGDAAPLALVVEDISSELDRCRQWFAAHGWIAPPAGEI